MHHFHLLEWCVSFVNLPKEGFPSEMHAYEIELGVTYS